MSEELKCQHCGGEYQDYLTDAGICCFSCGTEPYEEQSRLCKEIVARRKAEDKLAESIATISRLHEAIGHHLMVDSWFTKRTKDIQEVARIAVEYIEDPERRAFYRNQIEVAGTDAFQKGGAR